MHLKEIRAKDVLTKLSCLTYFVSLLWLRYGDINTCELSGIMMAKILEYNLYDFCVFYSEM